MNAEVPMIRCEACAQVVVAEHRTTLIDLIAEARERAAQRRLPLAPVSQHPAPHLAPCGLPCGGGGAKYRTGKEWFWGLVDGLTGAVQWHHHNGCAVCGPEHPNHPERLRKQ